MSALVSSFENLEIGDFNYLFIVVTWNEYSSTIAEEIDKQVEPFGAHLGLKGQVVRAFRNASYDTAEQVKAKSWPEEIKEKLETSQDPIIIVIDQDFTHFNPNDHQWAIIWFSDYFEKVGEIYKVFGLLANKTKKDEDLFIFLKDQRIKNNIRRWLKFIEIKPGAFGFSINGNELLETLL